jgi:hypothetical protein
MLAVGQGLAPGQPRAEDPADSGVQDPAGAHLLQRADPVPQPADRLQAPQGQARDTDVVVRTEVRQPGAKPVQIDYNLEKADRAGRSTTSWWPASASSPTTATVSARRCARWHRWPDQVPQGQEQAARCHGVGQEMIRTDGPRLSLSGPLTVATAGDLATAGRGARDRGRPGGGSVRRHPGGLRSAGSAPELGACRPRAGRRLTIDQPPPGWSVSRPSTTSTPSFRWPTEPRPRP